MVNSSIRDMLCAYSNATTWTQEIYYSPYRRRLDGLEEEFEDRKHEQRICWFAPQKVVTKPPVPIVRQFMKIFKGRHLFPLGAKR